MVHAITDGRDTSPTGGAGYLSTCEDALAKVGARISTVVGRYYAMDRDKRWERTKLAWDAIVNGIGEVQEVLPSEAARLQYAQDNTDEFLKPMVFDHANEQRVVDGDVVVFFNFRADRARQLSMAFLDKKFSGFDRIHSPKVTYLTLTEYDETYNCLVAFPPENLGNVLGKVVADAGLKQLRIAETATAGMRSRSTERSARSSHHRRWPPTTSSRK
jgi:2,3-bisphosphoglycerate-independent phosphoglycerate mutase